MKKKHTPQLSTSENNPQLTPAKLAQVRGGGSASGDPEWRYVPVRRISG